jgi:hypothetical protein
MIWSQTRASDERKRRPVFGLRPVNLLLLTLGVAAVAVGYVLLSRGSTVAAPLVLVLGYAGFVPAGLLVGFRRGAGSERDAGE